MTRFITWNVNSIRVRLPAVQHLLQTYQPDYVALQEIKTEQFPIEAFPDWHVVFAGQRQYNGVAWLSKTPIQLDENAPCHSRYIAITTQHGTLTNVYVPNGNVLDHPSFQEKLVFLRHLYQYRPAMFLGDFNVAPSDADVWSVPVWQHTVITDAAVRQLLMAFLEHYTDAGRDASYTWWDYRTHGFSKNHGLRIDLMLVNNTLAPFIKQCYVATEYRAMQRPSDHAPVILDLCSSIYNACEA
jgi:exodeoxyribonuclease III